MTRRDETMEAAAFLRECLDYIANAFKGDPPDIVDVRAKISEFENRLIELDAQMTSMSSTILQHTGKLDAHDTRLGQHDSAILANDAAIVSESNRNDGQDKQLERHRRRIRWLERLHHWAGFWRPNPAP